MNHNGKRKRRHHKEIMGMYDQFRQKFPAAVREEIVTEGIYYTLARVMATVNEGFIVGEGLSRRSGGNGIVDGQNSELAKEIALGRAHTACAIKLAYHKPWVKLKNLLMA